MTTSASETELMEQIRLKPNRKVIVFKAHLWANYIGKQVGLNKIGESPIVVDSALIKQSADNIHRYLIKKGYFDNTVTYEVDQTKIAQWLHMHKQRVTYYVDEGIPYTIFNVKHITQNAVMDSLLKTTKTSGYIKKNEALDFENISRERDRLSQLFRNNGFYYFNPSFIKVELDTSSKKRKVFVQVNVTNPELEPHAQQVINHVNVIYQTDSLFGDTVVDEQSGVRFVMNGMDISSAVIVNNILLKKGDYFSQKRLSTTYGRLINLNLFTTVNVELVADSNQKNGLNVFVLLKPAPKFDFTWQPQIITTEQRFNNSQSSRNYGLANELTLRNKNVFHNGEEFNIHLRTALETQFTADSNSAFSTFIQEVNTELKIPQLLFFRKKGNALKVNYVRTNVNASFLFETNPFYKRNSFPLSYTYEVSDNRFRLAYSPLLISLNQATYKEKLYDQATQSYLQTLSRIFTNNLITSQQFSGFYSSKKEGDVRHWTVNSNFLELAGIWLPKLTDYGKKYNVNHSSFIRSDVDFRYYIKLNENNALVFRTFGGIGVPLTKESVLPFERRFTSGGSNYLRGWRLRTVGPGAFSAANNLQLARTGELGLLANMEYRFNIIRSSFDINSALFIDMGNVWNLKADTLFPNGEFDRSRFVQELAVNTGVGFRFDFQFLILRTDLGIPLWDPNFPLEDRAVIKGAFKDGWIFKRPVWNVAVGYPF